MMGRRCHLSSRRLGQVLAAVLLLAAPLAPARAEHFDIHLTLHTAIGTADAGWDTTPPEGGVNPRHTAHAAIGEDITLVWRIRDEYPHGPMKQVLVRIFARAEDAPGQKHVPEPTAFTLLDTSFVADFLPDHSGHGRVRFRASRPGAYLVRLETANTLLEHGHEHFSALDLIVDAPQRAARLSQQVRIAARTAALRASVPLRGAHTVVRSLALLVPGKP